MPAWRLFLPLESYYVCKSSGCAGVRARGQAQAEGPIPVRRGQAVSERS